MKTLNCQQIRARFDERLDERLDPPARAAFDEHLAGCAGCRDEWRAYAGAWEILGRHVAIEPSFGFAERTLRRLAETPAATPAWWRLPVWRWATVGSALVVLAVGGWGVRQRATAARHAAEIYAHVQHGDYLEDYDVIASLDQLQGGNEL